MDFRLATIQDLGNIKLMYDDLIGKMIRNGIEIWDDVFPFMFFRADITNKRFYILEDEYENKDGYKDIIGAFVLNKTAGGSNHMKWEEPIADALYLGRLAVNVEYLNKGIGTKLLNHAIQITQDQEIDYLRLMVVDINEPAINFYNKNGFTQVGGSYLDKINENVTLLEYGYELKVF